MLTDQPGLIGSFSEEWADDVEPSIVTTHTAKTKKRANNFDSLFESSTVATAEDKDPTCRNRRTLHSHVLDRTMCTIGTVQCSVTYCLIVVMIFLAVAVAAFLIYMIGLNDE